MEIVNYLENKSDLDVELAAGTFTGVISLMPNHTYHLNTKYYSSSQLKYLHSKSPMHFKARYIDEMLPYRNPTEDMLVGTLVHSKVLTPEDFDNEFLPVPRFDGRTKEGKELKAKYEAEAKTSGKIIIAEDINDIANHMAMAIANHKTARKLLNGIFTELSFFWKCPFSGLNFRAKLDGFCEGYLLELKTTRDGSPDGFSRQAYNMHYDLSLTHYLKGCGHRQSYFVTVENEAPYCVQTYIAGDDFTDTGQEKWLDAVTKLEAGLTQNIWPGYVDERMEECPILFPPRFAIKKIKEVQDGI